MRVRGQERLVVDVGEPAVAAGHHSGHVEVIYQRSRAAARVHNRQHVPQRVASIASVGVLRRHAQTPIEVAEHRLREGDGGGVGGREPIARVRECVFPDLTLAAEALHGFIRVLEQEGVPNDRLPLIGRLGRARVSVDVRDARGPRLERRDAKDVEQAIHERFAMRRALVREASVLGGDRVVARLAAVGADLDDRCASKRRISGQVVRRDLQLQLRERTFAAFSARVAAEADLHALNFRLAAGRTVSHRTRHRQIAVVVCRGEQLIERRGESEREHLGAREEM